MPMTWRCEAQPGNGKLRYNRGVALGHMQRFAEALAEFEAILATGPRHPHALSAAANAALNLCDWPKVRLFGDRIAQRGEGKFRRHRTLYLAGL